MDFVSAVKTIKAQRGVTNVFYAMLCDYGAFDDEERWVKGIVKQICEDGYATKLSQSPSTTEIADMMYKLTNQYGYDKNNVSNIFHKLALGLGVVKASFDWDKEFNAPASEPASLNPTQPNPTPVAQKSDFCPQCGTPYYKSYSAFCAICGRKRW